MTEASDGGSVPSDLAGQVALVSGGGTGLGAAVCERLAAAGASVAVNWSKSEEGAEAVTSRIREAGGRGVACRADVRDEREVAAMVAEVERSLGPVDLLVNNAGVTRFVPFEDLEGVTAADWEQILAVNLIGAWNCTRAVAPGMRTAGAGAVVNVASDSAFTFVGSSIPYVVSKSALVTLTRVLARALAPAVRVNAVAPGWMATGWIERYLPEERLDALRRQPEEMIPVEEVAQEILRLLSDGVATGRVVIPGSALEGTEGDGS